jgi:glycosidase
MMDFPLHGVLRDALTEAEGQSFGVGLGRLYDAMINDVQYPDPAQLLLFEGNHDTNRIFSALGEDPALNRMAMAFIATTKRTPQIFYGSEILMTSPLQREDGQVRADFPGGWPDDRINAFTGQGLSAPQRDAQDYLRRLLNWRKTATVVHQGRLMHYAPLDGCYVYFRYTEKEKLMVVLNKNQMPMPLDTRRFAEMLRPQSVGVDVLSGERHSLGSQLVLPARSALILAIE